MELWRLLLKNQGFFLIVLTAPERSGPLGFDSDHAVKNHYALTPIYGFDRYRSYFCALLQLTSQS